MTTFRGTLIPIGGNEDKGENESSGLDFIDHGILSHVVRESGGVEARILVIPTASSIPQKVGENYLSAFHLLACNNVKVLNLTNSDQCNSDRSIEMLREANCVLFSGGNQSRITTIIGGTDFHKLLQERFKNEKIVIAGTSAGAMAMSLEMIAGGSSKEAMLKGAVLMKKGLCLLPKVIMDTHFIRRGRFGRLAEAMAMFPHCIGLGLGEDTGVIIKNCNECMVIGSGMVIVFDPSKLTHNKHAELKEGTPISMSNLITHILANGDRFTIEDMKIDVLTVAAKFL